MHMLNYSHNPSAVELTEMRRLHERAAEKVRNEIIATEQRRAELVRQRGATPDPRAQQQLSGIIGRVDADLADAKRRQRDHHDTLAELDRRINAASPAAA